MSKNTLRSRIEGSFLCLAVTDALGAPLEFGPRRTDRLQHVTSMLPNANFNLPAGHFTDDTSMALCLAVSLLESEGQTDTLSQATAYLSWFREGRMSSVPGTCFDIGTQTAETLNVWEKAIQKINAAGVDDDVEAMVNDTQAQITQHFSDENRCGNGSLMRVLPCILVAKSEEHAIQLARESSNLTHPNPRCADACSIYAIMVYRALHGASKDDLFQTLRKFMTKSDPNQVDYALSQAFVSYTSIDGFSQKPLSQVRSSGYVVHTLDAALWAFFTTDTYEEGAIKVVNLGDDADTVGAVYGGLAGAFYGHVDVIPRRWLDAMKSMNIVNGVISRILHSFHSATE